MNVKTKVCAKCGAEKPLGEYWNHPHCKDGKRSRCKLCCKQENSDYVRRVPQSKEYAQSYYERNKEKIKESAKAWQKKGDNRRRKNLKDRYGITLEDYDALLKEQNNVCAICGLVMNEGKRLAVDHDHKTGKIRGILHVRCNTAIALFKDSPEICRNAALYLEKFR